MDSSARKRNAGEMVGDGIDPDPQKKRKREEWEEGSGLIGKEESSDEPRLLREIDVVVDLSSEQQLGFDRTNDRQRGTFRLGNQQSSPSQNGKPISRIERNDYGAFSHHNSAISRSQANGNRQQSIRSISKTTKTNNSLPFDDKSIKATKQVVQKSSAKRVRKGKNAHEDSNLNEKNVSKIADPPSYNKNNLVITRGVDFVPVDNHFSKKDEARVLDHNKAFYSVTLSQSNLATDDNKFFIIQLLEVSATPQPDYYLFSRWGRVGVNGQMYENGPISKKEAIRQYNAKTQAKLNHGGYKVVEMSYDNDKQLQEKELEEIDQYLAKDNSRLPEKVEQLMKLIFDMKMMQTNMRQIGYDEKRSPLGLIARTAIDKGYIALDNIMRVLKNDAPESQKRNQLNQFSSEFYSAIPHDFGYVNMKAFVINSEEKVKQKLEMLASLSQIQIYSNLMNEKTIDEHLPAIDIKYSKLKCEISPLAKEAAAYSVIQRYLTNTHAKTHDKYVMELAEIFTLKRPQEDEKFMKGIGNMMLLWHGSRLTNYVGILSEGLKIAPYEAPSTGYMFGKGIYFADIASKSANYCLPKHNSTGLLLLCEVALGEMNDKFAADYTAQNLPAGRHSTRGVGKFAPKSGEMLDGVFVPNGELQSTGIQQTSLLYNEYVVYNRDQIQCKYIVRVNFLLKK